MSEFEPVQTKYGPWVISSDPCVLQKLPGERGTPGERSGGVGVRQMGGGGECEEDEEEVWGGTRGGGR